MSKPLTTRLQETLPDLIPCQQTAYVKKTDSLDRALNLYQIY